MDEWLTAEDAARALTVGPDTVRAWAHSGKIRRSTKSEAGGLLVRRTEVDRVLDARAAAQEQRVSRWQPMTERVWVSGSRDEE